MDKTEHPAILTRWKNIFESAYDKQLDAHKVKPYEEEDNLHDNKHYWTSSIEHEIMLFYFQDILIHADNTIIKHYDQNLLK